MGILGRPGICACAPPAVLAALLVSAGCEAPPPPTEPAPFEQADTFSASGQAVLAARWWEAFDDASLNERVEVALQNNYDLSAAWQRIVAARALANRVDAQQSVELDGTAGVENRGGSGTTDQTQWSLGLAASYEVDLWGGIESQAEAERLRASATAADYRTVAISLSASVALTWYQIAEARQQLELIASQVETNQTVLEVLEGRFAIGQVQSADVLRQRQLVEATREQLVVTRSRLEVLEHQLAVLEGRPAQQNAELPAAALPVVPEAPATGLPAELLQRRPDIQSAYLRLQAADEDVAAAVSDQYPRLNLIASLSTQAERSEDLFREWVGSVAGQLVAPLIDGGAREAEVDRTQAIREQRLAEYAGQVLGAFAETEDALAQELYQTRRIDSLRAQLQLAEQTYQQLRNAYLNGTADYLSVLSAIREQQQLERDLLGAQLQRVSFRIALYRALAGGFETPREAEAEAGAKAETESSGPARAEIEPDPDKEDAERE